MVAADPRADRIARDLKIFLENASENRVRPSLRRESPVSFEEIVSPAVTFALDRLRRAARPMAPKILETSAWQSLGRHLTQRLAFALGPTLRLEQNIAQAVARSLEKGNALRNRKITLLETVQDFPGALETAAQLIASWIDAQSELLTRLVRDEHLLCSVFLRNRKEFRLRAIRPGLSDPHDGGRSVTIIEFANGDRVIYKPRSCAREQIWFEALAGLNRNGFQLVFRVPRLVGRQNYSWMEFLRASGCRNFKAVSAFYFRWGAQAALAQILGASDLHRDNWLAVGPQPVLVDAELIGSERSRRLTAFLETGLLPLTARDRAGFYRGIAPFDATLSATGQPSCWPRCKGKPQPPSKYIDDLIRGFEAVAEIFAQRDSARQFFREIISRPAQRGKPRLLLRSSSEYARLLQQSLAVAYMISPGQRWRWLARTCVASAVSRSLGLAEARALLRCDIPKLVARRKIYRPPWKDFSTKVAELKDSARVFRNRVLLRRRVRRRRLKPNLMPRG